MVWVPLKGIARPKILRELDVSVKFEFALGLKINLDAFHVSYGVNKINTEYVKVYKYTCNCYFQKKQNVIIYCFIPSQADCCLRLFKYK